MAWASFAWTGDTSGLAAINRGESFQNSNYVPMHCITLRTHHLLMTPNALSSSFLDSLSRRMNNRLGNSLVRSSLMFLCSMVVYGDGEVEVVVRGVLGAFVDGGWSLGRRPVDGSEGAIESCYVRLQA